MQINPVLLELAMVRLKQARSPDKPQMPPNYQQALPGDLERCGSCKHMTEGNTPTCNRYHTAVQPEMKCNSWEPKELDLPEPPDFSPGDAMVEGGIPQAPKMASATPPADSGAGTGGLTANIGNMRSEGPIAGPDEAEQLDTPAVTEMPALESEKIPEGPIDTNVKESVYRGHNMLSKLGMFPSQNPMMGSGSIAPPAPAGAPQQVPHVQLPPEQPLVDPNPQPQQQAGAPQGGGGATQQAQQQDQQQQQTTSGAAAWKPSPLLALGQAGQLPPGPQTTAMMETQSMFNQPAAPPPQPQQKLAFVPSWGGGSYLAGGEHGPGVEFGYKHLLGLLPLPNASLRYGYDNGMGASLGTTPIVPTIGIDSGHKPGWQWSKPRSLWGHLQHKLSGKRSEKEEQDVASQPHELSGSNPSNAEKKGHAMPPGMYELWRNRAAEIEKIASQRVKLGPLERIERVYLESLEKRALEHRCLTEANNRRKLNKRASLGQNSATVLTRASSPSLSPSSSPHSTFDAGHSAQPALVAGVGHAKRAEADPELVIDRPKGFKKTFTTSAGKKELTYPMDYGYFKGLINPEDKEDADVFVGTGGPLHGRFNKGSMTSGTWKPDEHKWYSGLHPHEHQSLQDWWDTAHDKGLVRDWTPLADRPALLNDIKAHIAARQAPVVKLANMMTTGSPMPQAGQQGPQTGVQMPQANAAPLSAGPTPVQPMSTTGMAPPAVKPPPPLPGATAPGGGVQTSGQGGSGGMSGSGGNSSGGEGLGKLAYLLKRSEGFSPDRPVMGSPSVYSQPNAGAPGNITPPTPAMSSTPSYDPRTAISHKMTGGRPGNSSFTPPVLPNTGGSKGGGPPAPVPQVPGQYPPASPVAFAGSTKGTGPQSAVDAAAHLRTPGSYPPVNTILLAGGQKGTGVKEFSPNGAMNFADPNKGPYVSPNTGSRGRQRGPANAFFKPVVPQQPSTTGLPTVASPQPQRPPAPPTGAAKPPPVAQPRTGIVPADIPTQTGVKNNSPLTKMSRLIYNPVTGSSGTISDIAASYASLIRHAVHLDAAAMDKRAMDDCYANGCSNDPSKPFGCSCCGKCGKCNPKSREEKQRFGRGKQAGWRDYASSAGEGAGMGAAVLNAASQPQFMPYVAALQSAHEIAKDATRGKFQPAAALGSGLGAATGMAGGNPLGKLLGTVGGGLAHTLARQPAVTLADWTGRGARYGGAAGSVIGSSVGSGAGRDLAKMVQEYRNRPQEKQANTYNRDYASMGNQGNMFAPGNFRMNDQYSRGYGTSGMGYGGADYGMSSYNRDFSQPDIYGSGGGMYSRDNATMGPLGHSGGSARIRFPKMAELAIGAAVRHMNKLAATAADPRRDYLSGADRPEPSAPVPALPPKRYNPYSDKQYAMKSPMAPPAVVPQKPVEQAPVETEQAADARRLKAWQNQQANPTPAMKQFEQQYDKNKAATPQLPPNAGPQLPRPPMMATYDEKPPAGRTPITAPTPPRMATWDEKPPAGRPVPQQKVMMPEQAPPMGMGMMPDSPLSQPPATGLSQLPPVASPTSFRGGGAPQMEPRVQPRGAAPVGVLPKPAKPNTPSGTTGYGHNTGKLGSAPLSIHPQMDELAVQAAAKYMSKQGVWGLPGTPPAPQYVPAPPAGANPGTTARPLPSTKVPWWVRWMGTRAFSPDFISGNYGALPANFGKGDPVNKPGPSDSPPSPSASSNAPTPTAQLPPNASPQPQAAAPPADEAETPVSGGAAAAAAAPSVAGGSRVWRRGELPSPYSAAYQARIRAPGGAMERTTQAAAAAAAARTSGNNKSTGGTRIIAPGQNTGQPRPYQSPKQLYGMAPPTPQPMQQPGDGKGVGQNTTGPVGAPKGQGRGGADDENMAGSKLSSGQQPVGEASAGSTNKGGPPPTGAGGNKGAGPLPPSTPARPAAPPPPLNQNS